jgi:hypothetical protein
VTAGEADAIIDKAAKAHGGAENLSKERAVRSRGTGTLEIMGLTLNFTQENVAGGGKFKESMTISFMGNESLVVTVFDGTNAWVKSPMEVKALDGKLLDEIKEAAYMARLGRLAFIKDKSVELTPLGEAKVNDRPVVGVRVSSKGHRDLNMYFDKETGLLTKTERRALDAQTMQEVTEERLIQGYQDADGMKVAKKVVINRDGKKFMEIEVKEVTFPDKLDDGEFAKP